MIVNVRITSTWVFGFNRYDLVDLTRQSLSKLANQVYLDAISAFHHEDVKALSLHSQKFLQLIKDIDKLLAADDNFLLGTWLESAKNLAMNSDEMKQVRTAKMKISYIFCQFELLDLTGKGKQEWKFLN